MVHSLVIDISAVPMMLLSLTGLVLIFYLQKKRLSGLLVAAAGLVLCYRIYAAFVPQVCGNSVRWRSLQVCDSILVSGGAEKSLGAADTSVCSRSG